MAENKTGDKESRDLVDYALSHGASRAVVISGNLIRVREELAALCKTCPNHGQALSCPPHVKGPDTFRQWIKPGSRALVLKIDVAAEILMSTQRHEIYRALHDMAAELETEAKKLGFSDARAFAGGSCKTIFCSSHPDCRALDSSELCRFPEAAKPSMSGFGIDVAALIDSAGWGKESFLENQGLPASDTAGIYGLVLLGPGPGIEA